MKKIREQRISPGLSIPVTAVYVSVPIIPNFLYQRSHPDDGNTSIIESWRAPPEHNCTTADSYESLKHFSRGISLNNACDNIRALQADVTNRTTSWIREQQRAIKQKRHDDIINANIPVGLMFASKAIVQLIANPFVGPLTNR